MLFIRNFKRFKHNWIKPDGYDTGIKVYNCVTKNKQPLIVKNKNLVSWYTCGPTVYDSAHIGHASCFLKLDIIQRILRQYSNLNLVTVMNITDIDDKIIARSNSSKIPVGDLVTHYEKEFWKDLDTLGINKPNIILRVTENIEVIKKFIKKLLREGKAYQSEDNSVYFDLSAYDNYGKLQNISQEDVEPVKFKKSSMDFALWKAAKPNEIFWSSEWGEGRPGWHIECSALASHVFGSKIDIHAGGIDLRFPHHENEEAQSCQLHKTTQWVNYWFHTGHLHLKDSEKMSKSLKNTVSVSTLLENTTPEMFRMACIMSHYRSSMEYGPEFMATAANVLKNYYNFMDNCTNYIKGLIKADVDDEFVHNLINRAAGDIDGALKDDFNTPQVLKILNEVISKVNNILHSSKTSLSESKSVSIIAAKNLVSETLILFGLHLNEKMISSDSDNNFEEVVNILIDFRHNIRQIGLSRKDTDLLKLCDSVRDDLKKCGINVKDHGKSSSWS